MSFEGYYQLLCKNGHYYNIDVYGGDDDTPCPYCQSECIWWNLVDTTNAEGNPVPMLEINRKICEHCNTVLETKYVIPSNRGHKK